MKQIFIWVLFILLSQFLRTTKSDNEDVSNSLISFYNKLSNSNSPHDPVLGWNLSSDPCTGPWTGLTCDNRTHSVKKIFLDSLSFTGTFDASTLCNVQSIAASLIAVNLNNNLLHGENLDEIVNCRELTHLQIGGNRFSGSLPDSLSRLHNLKVLNISSNNFYGSLPDLTLISGLQEFFAQNNQLTGTIPNLDFSNFEQFNVSFNNFTGHVPNGGDRFPVSSFIGNPELCGDLLPRQCPSLPPKKSKGISNYQVLMFSGYFITGLTIFLVIILLLCKRGKTKEEKANLLNKEASFDDSFYKPSFTSGEYKAGLSKSGISAVTESGMVSSSLIVLTSPEVNGLKFDDLLKAPAELLGRGKHGTVYKVIGEQGMTLAVKRIKDWTIPSNDFKQRMRRLDQVKHPNVLPPVALYCSKQEKLLVYEYQENGSLFRLLQGSQLGQVFDWSSRLSVAATITNALAFMHQELREDGIAHGNLKSSNILLNKNMEPCVSEYGLMMVDNEDQSSLSNFGTNSAFKADIYGIGVILLELLTGKVGQNNGLDLAEWVLSVVREEWTGEVFDKSLIREGAREEGLVYLLQIAVKCVNASSPEARPSMNQLALMINTIKEEEERSISISIVSEP
ncbi:probable inactive receptor kinase At2g26730 [Actinidia eriantha]|uniref:probable inactive receptor kinase At2g26730 n=1 Tax=Actinidia eriantha TaxID=165200 RepID=UPI0025850479|nr:probable inactive receptor kinase At2g26730 [Actinidia eriantha]XP_057482420.1 probable inactive receptor kinase At2g26730 [Actinidia eriantha]